LDFIDQILLFGSRARSDNAERADIDLAIFCTTATAKNWFKIMDIIDDTDTLLKIDCIRLDELSENSDLKRVILSQAIKLYERKN